jgi:ribosomal protein S12 methylthiotransferase accessory factor
MRRRALVEGVRDFSRTPTFEADTFEEDVAWELSQLRRAGHDRVVLIDLTLPEIGLTVVRVVVPGMELDSDGAGRRRSSDTAT